jgi:hypothetical protein
LATNHNYETAVERILNGGDGFGIEWFGEIELRNLDADAPVFNW